MQRFHGCDCVLNDVIYALSYDPIYANASYVHVNAFLHGPYFPYDAYA